MYSWKWKNWQYKNITLLAMSLIFFFFFVNTSDIFQRLISNIGSVGYLGAFVSGVFFVSIFTVAPASVVLFDLAKSLNPFMVAIFAGAGAGVGDYLIFRFLKNKVFEELDSLFKNTTGSFIKKLFLSPFFVWLIPIAGAFIIASPLPDEFGISLLGLSKVKNWHFVLITFLLNSIGIFSVILLARS